jgi:RNA polymerase sigma-70 factor (ECF subfamily)
MNVAQTAAREELAALEAASSPALSMDETAFRLFYDRTARPLRAYLCRLTGDPHRADDLLQESYLRLLRANLPHDITESHLRNYLFKTATNAERDFRRQHRTVQLEETSATSDSHAQIVESRRDLQRHLDLLKPKDKQLLWLAYVERFSHIEIAGMLGAKPQSIRPMLSRARQRFARLLKGDRRETA